MNPRNLITFAVIALLSTVSMAASAETITLARGITVTVASDWTAIQDTRNSYTLEHRTEGKLNASMVIQIEQRISHAEALQRLTALRTQYPSASTFALIAGWPALEWKVVAPFQHPGEQEKDQVPLHGPETSTQVLTAVAVGDFLIRFQTLLQPGANPQLADESMAMARTLTAPQANPTQSEQELHELQSAPMKSAPVAPQVHAPARPPSAAGLQPQPRHRPTGGSGSIQVQGAGEIEATASLNGQDFVTDAACGISYSTNGGASFTGSNVSGTSANGNTKVPSGLDGDCTVAWGPSGNFYLGQLGSQFVALYSSTAPSNGAQFNYLTLAVDRRPTSTNSGTNVDQPHIVADRWNFSSTNQDRLYVVWQETGSFVSRIACSSNSGSTWSTTPVDAHSGNFGYPRAAVGRDGMVYEVSRNWPNQIILDKFSSCDAGLAEQSGFPVTINFSDVIGSTCQNGAIPGLDRCNDGNTLASPTVVVDDNDSQHVFISWAQMNASLSGEDIVVAESHNGGVKWGVPVLINSDITATRFMPWLGTWSGTAYLGWYDRRFAGSTSSDPDDFTRYFDSNASSAGGVLSAGSETDLTGIDDPQCASGWGNGTREPQDATQCTVQPQEAGFCGSTNTRCDFVHACSGGLSCNTASGIPKYGDYNGLAVGGARLLQIWASGTAPSDLAATGNNSIRAYVNVTPLPLHVHQMYYNNASWSDQDLTATTSGTLANPGTGLASFSDSFGEHAYFVGTDQHVHQLYYDNASWSDQDLTSMTNGAQAAPGAGMAGFSDSYGEHAYFVAPNQHVHQMYYDNANWTDQDLTATTNGALAGPDTGMSSFSDSYGEHATFVDGNQHVHQLYYSNSAWTDQDLTSAASGALAISGTGMAGFSDSYGEHVYFLTANQHVHQLYFDNSSWTDQDLTATTNGALANPGTGLAAFSDSFGEHAYFVATNQHVHQLYYDNGNWTDQDLTSTTNGSLANLDSGVAVFLDTAGEHATFVATNQHVHQLFYNNSSWSDQDLTGFANGALANPVTSMSGFHDTPGEHAFYVAPATAAASATPFTSLNINIATGNDDARSDTELTATFPDEPSICLKPSNNAAPDPVCANGGSATDQNGKQDWGNWTSSAQQFSLTTAETVEQLGTITINLIEHNNGLETDDNWDIQGITVTGVDSQGNSTVVLNLSNPQVSGNSNNCIARLKGPPNPSSVTYNLSASNPTGSNLANPTFGPTPPGSCPQ